MVSFSMDSNGNIRRDDTSVEDFCTWAEGYQKSCFPRHDPDIHIEIVDDAGGPACFVRSAKTIYIEKSATVSEKFSRIALLHEIIHINLIEDNGDPDEDHGDRFQTEVKRLFETGAYRKLL
jgi:hypothetical protein